MRRPAAGAMRCRAPRLAMADRGRSVEASQENRDYYSVLGIPPSADRETISKAYRRLMKSVHPDAHRGRADPAVGRRVAELVEAWRVLGDDARRAEYDRSRRRRPGEPGDVPNPPRREPRLAVSPTHLDLGTVRRGSIAEGRLRLDNRGGPATAVERLGSTPHWLSVRAEPEAPGSPFPMILSLRADTAGLASRRRHRAELVLRIVNHSEGLRSGDETVAVSLGVAPQPPPRLIARPGGWRARPCECQGAPRSLVLQLLVANQGGGQVPLKIEASPWIRVARATLGPLREGQSVLLPVEVDCAGWREAGWRDGAIWLEAESGEVLEVPLLAELDSESNSSEGWAGLLARCWGFALAAALGPAVSLPLGVPSLGAAVAVLAALCLPGLFRTARRREILLKGPPAESAAWEMGPAESRQRLWFSVLLWAVLGGLLAASGTGTLFGPVGVPASTAVAVLAGATAAVSVGDRGGFLSFALRDMGRASMPLRGAMAVAVPLSWSILGAVGWRAVGASLGGELAAWGTVAGWAIGVAVVCVRSDALPANWRKVIVDLLWELVPTLASGLGFAASLILAMDWSDGIGLIGNPLIPAGSGASSALVELPAASLHSGLLALAASVGLLIGYGLGLTTIQPAMEVPALPEKGAWSGGAIAAWLRDLALAIVVTPPTARGPVRGAAAGDSRSEALRGCLAELPWSAAAVAAGGGLLLIYSTASLLLAVFAALGMLVG